MDGRRSGSYPNGPATRRSDVGVTDQRERQAHAGNTAIRAQSVHAPNAAPRLRRRLGGRPYPRAESAAEESVLVPDVNAAVRPLTERLAPDDVVSVEAVAAIAAGGGHA